MAGRPDDPIFEFEDRAAFRDWLETHHADVPAIFAKLHKKASGLASITYSEAVDEALCWGWIDGVKYSFDDKSYLQRFTPRRAKSIWSKVNVGKVEQQIAEGRMQPTGLAEVEAAKADGRWEAAYDGSATAEMPDEFLKVLKAEPEAQAFFQTLTSQNRFAIYHRLTTPKKPETRTRKIGEIVAMLKRGETFHPQGKRKT